MLVWGEKMQILIKEGLMLIKISIFLIVSSQDICHSQHNVNASRKRFFITIAARFGVNSIY